MAIGNESAPIQLAQFRLPGLTVTSAEILIYFSNKIHGNNFIKQHSETDGLKLPKRILQFKKKIIVPFIIVFGTLSFSIHTLMTVT